jgi:hypothetical protein
MADVRGTLSVMAGGGAEISSGQQGNYESTRPTYRVWKKLCFT